MADTPTPLTRLMAGVATIAATLAAIALVTPLRHSVSLAGHGHFAALRAYVQSLGVGGLALLMGLVLAHAVVFYPSEIATATAGYVYGFAAGLGLMLGGWLVAALLTYALGRSVGRPLLRAVLGRRFDRVQGAMHAGGTSLLLAGRLIPVVPFALLGYAAGAAHVNVWRFAWTTVVGYLPLTVAVTYLGSRAQTLSVSDPLVWVAVAVLLGLAVTHGVLARRAAAARRAGDPPVTRS